MVERLAVLSCRGTIQLHMTAPVLQRIFVNRRAVDGQVIRRARRSAAASLEKYVVSWSLSREEVEAIMRALAPWYHTITEIFKCTISSPSFEDMVSNSYVFDDRKVVRRNNTTYHNKQICKIPDVQRNFLWCTGRRRRQGIKIIR